MDTVPGGWTPEKDPKCATYAEPVFDTVLAAVAVYGAIWAAGCEERDGHNCLAEQILFLPAAVVLGIPYAIAVPVGFYRARKCHAANQDHDEWLRLTPAAQELIRLDRQQQRDEAEQDAE
jgi:hypothetical protein